MKSLMASRCNGLMALVAVLSTMPCRWSGLPWWNFCEVNEPSLRWNPGWWCWVVRYGCQPKNNGKTTQIIYFNRVWNHYKPSILWYPYFWKHPYWWRKCWEISLKFWPILTVAEGAIEAQQSTGCCSIFAESYTGQGRTPERLWIGNWGVY